MCVFLHPISHSTPKFPNMPLSLYFLWSILKVYYFVHLFYGKKTTSAGSCLPKKCRMFAPLLSPRIQNASREESYLPKKTEAMKWSISFSFLEKWITTTILNRNSACVATLSILYFLKVCYMVFVASRPIPSSSLSARWVIAWTDSIHAGCVNSNKTSRIERTRQSDQSSLLVVRPPLLQAPEPSQAVQEPLRLARERGSDGSAPAAIPDSRRNSVLFVVWVSECARQLRDRVLLDHSEQTIWNPCEFAVGDRGGFAPHGDLQCGTSADAATPRRL